MWVKDKVIYALCFFIYKIRNVGSTHKYTDNIQTTFSMLMLMKAFITILRKVNFFTLNF